MENGLAWRSECQKAAASGRTSVRPEASVMVPEIMIGSVTPASSKASSIAAQRRLGVQRVENRLDQQDIGAALDEATRRFLVGGAQSSKVTARKPGFETSGEIDAVRLVGPIEPATKRLFAVLRLSLVAGLARELRAFAVQFGASASMP